MNFTSFLALLSKELGSIDLTSKKDLIKNTFSDILTSMDYVSMEDKEGEDDEVEVVDVSMQDQEGGDDESKLLMSAWRTRRAGTIRLKLFLMSA
jgi:hypothetical protein